MSESITWRVLHQCSDLLEARAVVTALAAMDFDARIVGSPPANDELHEADEAEFPGPYIIEVPAEDWPQLKEALPEIIAEQKEFDLLTDRDAQIKTASFKAVIAVALIVMLIFLLSQLGN
jgi:hypothetical protein